MFCCTLLYVHSSFSIILMEKRELVPLLSWCLVIAMGLSAVVIVVFPDHTHYFSAPPVLIRRSYVYALAQTLLYIHVRPQWESPAEFENQIKPLVYVRRIMRSSAACGFSPIKFHFSDYTKSLISRINKLMHFSIMKFMYFQL